MAKLKDSRKTRARRLQQLRFEQLENRQLLASDFSPHHNSLIAEDVNLDFAVSPLDALLVINAINDGGINGFGEGETSELAVKLDVNADNMLSAADVLQIINLLNAEGEDVVDPIIRFDYQIIDPDSGTPITGPVVVGDVFQIQVSVQDSRLAGNTGVFAAALDLGVSDTSLISYATEPLVAPLTNTRLFPVTIGGQRILIAGPTGVAGDLTQVVLVNSAAAGAGLVEFDTFTQSLRISANSSGGAADALVIQDQIRALSGFDASGATSAGTGSFVAGTLPVNRQTINIEGPGDWRFIQVNDVPADGAGKASYDAVRKTLIISGDANAANMNALTLQAAISALPEFNATGAANGGTGSFGVGLSRTFRFGTEFVAPYLNGRQGTEGNGIRINQRAVGTTREPDVDDGETFSLQVGSNTVVFEFDTDGSTNAANQAVSFSLGSTVTEIANAMIVAIESSSLGLLASNNGFGVVGLPLDQVVFNSLTSQLSLSLNSEEFFNEFSAFSTSSNAPPNPADSKAFFSIDVLAASPGTVTFTPNSPEFNIDFLVFGNGTRIPTSRIEFNRPFSVSIISDPTAPVAVNDNVTTAESTALALGANILGNDTRQAGRTLVIDSVSAIPGVTLGTINGTTYTPPANYFGPDSFTYVARDSSGLLSNSATVNVSVTFVNAAPNAFDDSFAVDDVTPNNPLNVLADNGNGADNAGVGDTGDTITITSVSLPANGSASIASGGTTVLYTPNPNFLGTDTFTYTITDAGGLTDTATVTVEVEAGDLPRARSDAATIQEGGIANVNVTNNDLLTNDTATPVLVSFTQGTRGTVAQNGVILVYTPSDPDFYGTDSFTYVLNDSTGLGENSTATVNITVQNVNDVPELVGDTATTAEEQVLTIAAGTLLLNDSAGAGEDPADGHSPSQSLTITSVSSTEDATLKGTVALNGTNVVYTPAEHFVGTFVFSYTARDNDATNPLSATANVTVTVTPVNDNPIANPDTFAGTEDTALLIPAGGTTIVAGNVVFNDRPGPASAFDEANQVLTVTGVSPTSAQNGTVALAGTTITYTPASNFNGQDTFTYTLSDGAGGTATGTVTINVAAVNDAPTAVADSATAFKDIPLNIPAATLLANDLKGPANESNQILTVTGVQATANTNGTVVLANGIVTFTPNAGYIGPASFEYTIQDNGGGTDNTSTGVVNVTVQEFVPSTISGFVFVDETNDGIIDAAERRLGGVEVTLTGVSLGQVLPAMTILTLGDGSYSFDGLGPGEYVVRYAIPELMADGKDIPGPLGDRDTVANQFTINIATPGGADASNYNFAVTGLESGYGRMLEMLASRHPVNRRVGATFAVGGDSTQQWTAIMDGFDGAVYAEAVVSASGKELLLTIVDSAHNIKTAVVGEDDWIQVNGANGTTLLRVLGGNNDFDWTPVSLSAAPALSATNYLEAVDAIFAQEGWDD
jgi:hypothetical protein